MAVDTMTIIYALRRNLVRIKNNENKAAYDELMELTRLIENEGVA